jgi:hypothetical protein
MAVRIDNLTGWANQITHVVLDDGTVVDFAFRYLAATSKWVVDVNHDTLTTKNLILATHSNVLRQWMHKIPFGLCCISSDGLDPMRQDDFKTGRITLWVLNADNVITVEKFLRASRG